jgi:hypothetical protein
MLPYPLPRRGRRDAHVLVHGTKGVLMDLLYVLPHLPSELGIGRIPSSANGLM